MEEKVLLKIKENISKAEASLKELRKDINKANTAGIDTKEMTERMNKYVQQIRLLKTAYG